MKSMMPDRDQKTLCSIGLKVRILEVNSDGTSIGIEIP